MRCGATSGWWKGATSASSSTASASRPSARRIERRYIEAFTDRRSPAPLVAVGGSIAASWFFGLKAAGVSIVGPSFSRIYDAEIGPYEKFKHVIEPRVDGKWFERDADGTIPGAADTLPLVIQDKTFVPDKAGRPRQGQLGY